VTRLEGISPPWPPVLSMTWPLQVTAWWFMLVACCPLWSIHMIMYRRVLPT